MLLSNLVAATGIFIAVCYVAAIGLIIASFFIHWRSKNGK